MNSNTSKNASYLKICSTLRSDIHLYANENGCLDPELVLCERLSASRKTLRKALDELRSEGVINTVKRRNYINHQNKCAEIGLLIDCNKVSPFLPANSVFIPFLEAMEKAGCHGRILAFPSVNNLSSLAKQYNLKGLIWFNPPESLHASIVEMSQKDNLRICCIINTYELQPDSPLKANYVALDKEHLGKKRASILLNRGHRNVICITHDDFAYKSFVDAMSVKGCEQLPGWRLDSPTQIFKHLATLVKRDKITAISSIGGPLLVSLFEELHKHAEEQYLNLELFLPNNDQARTLMEKSPRLKVTGLTDLCVGELGIEAMNMLSRMIQEQRDQRPVLIKAKINEVKKRE